MRGLRVNDVDPTPQPLDLCNMFFFKHFLLDKFYHSLPKSPLSSSAVSEPDVGEESGTRRTDKTVAANAAEKGEKGCWRQCGFKDKGNF